MVQWLRAWALQSKKEKRPGTQASPTLVCFIFFNYEVWSAIIFTCSMLQTSQSSPGLDHTPCLSSLFEWIDPKSESQKKAYDIPSLKGKCEKKHIHSMALILTAVLAKHQKDSWSKELIDSRTSIRATGANGALHNLLLCSELRNTFGQQPEFLLNNLNHQKGQEKREQCRRC